MPEIVSHSRYLVCGGSVTGGHHIIKGIPCEDALAYDTGTNYLIIAIADGLSSAELGGIGAEYLVKSCVRETRKIFTGSLPDKLASGSFSDTLKDVVIRARTGLQECANNEEHDLSFYASTLIVGVLYAGNAYCGHIGDGVCVTVRGDEIRLLSSPAHGEYINETPVLTSSTWEQDLRISSGPADAILLATDGCQGALIRKENGEIVPYRPFILPLIDSLQNYYPPGKDLDAEVIDLLSSKRMRALSSDDMTLAIGIQMSGEFT